MSHMMGQLRLTKNEIGTGLAQGLRLRWVNAFSVLL